MGIVNSKDLLPFNFNRRQIDEACSNTSLPVTKQCETTQKLLSSLSKLRYVAVEKPKWKVFGKRELRPITTYPVRGRKGCPCGANGPCKQKITPKGVVLHYPQRNKIFDKKYKPPKIEKAYLTDKDRPANNVKIVRPKKFAVPTWRVDKVMTISPFQRKIANSIQKRRRRREARRLAKAESQSDVNDESDDEDTKSKK